MNKATVTFVSLAAAGAFAAMVTIGFHYVRGVPVPIETPVRVVMETVKLNQDIDLSQGLAAELWQGLNATEVKMEPQVMSEPWGKVAGGPVQVKSFHNGRDIYFHLSWPDATENWQVKPAVFTDGCAIMLPLAKDAKPASLMMGFLGTANIWHWKASQDFAFWMQRSSSADDYADFHYPFEEEELFPVSKTIPVSAVNDLLAIRIGTLTPNEKQEITGRGVWKDGAWQVIIKRSLESTNPETQAVFDHPGTRQIAFALWDGAHEDRGGRKSISQWVELKVQ